MIAVSYDSVEVLREFTEKRGITFPLLSDAGSRVITELGLTDRDLVEHHAAFGIQTKDHQLGVAYPVTFILDEAGVVVGRRIQPNYRAREGVQQLLEDGLGIAPTAHGEVLNASAPRVRISAFTDSDSYVRWARTRLHVELDVDPRWHIYSSPVPLGYTPFTVEIGSQPEVEVGAPVYPAPHPFTVKGLGEEFMVLEGLVRVVVPIAINVPPGRGVVVLNVTVRYQACSDTECLPPSAMDLEIPLQEAPPG